MSRVIVLVVMSITLSVVATLLVTWASTQFRARRQAG